VTEHPEDEQERDEQELEAAQEHVADEPAAEQPGAAEPNTEETPEAPAAAAPPDEAPAPEAAAAPPEEAPAPEAAAAPPEEAPAAQAPAEQAPAESAEEASALEEDEELEEPAPRQRPEIPGADLVPDIVPEGEEFLDAEARAAAEAEAEAAAARERDQEPEEEARPIADAAIDLAAGARYTATGKRKTAVARVILKPGAGTYLINGKQLDQFFPRETLQRIIRQPLETVGYESRMDVVARMHGGGVAAQAGALRHGISRALLVADPNLRSELKRRGFLTRDPRVKERKKAGLKKARKRPQFSKR
jgi:small subunit ribosomal protein S9